MEDRLQKFNQRLNNASTPNRGVHYWILYTLPNGQRVIDGPEATEDSATNSALSKTNTMFRVIPLNTRNKGEATSRIKHIIAQETNDLPEALKRVKHKI